MIRLLQTLRLKGFATPAALTDRLGPDAEAWLAEAQAAGLATVAKMGARLTPEGQAAADAAWAADAAALPAGLAERLYAAFDAPNAAFKQLVADWQMRDGAPNDHQDASYDAVILERLDAVLAELRPLLTELAAALPRLRDVAARFDAAAARVRAGERRWLAGPLIDSVHTIWFELHEELIRLSGRTRKAEAARGAAA